MKSLFPLSRSFNPWIVFFLFTTVNALLSYIPLTLTAKLEIVFFGVMIPLLLALRYIHTNPYPRISTQTEFLPHFSLWIFVFLGIATVFVRFYMLTTLSVWPNFDEGLWGFLAIDFYHHLDWSLFYQDNLYPSVYFWGLGLLFKFFKPSLFFLWFYPALLSLLVVPVGFWAARQFFSKSFSIFITLFLAFSFWPLYVGRYADQMILSLLLECLLFLAWGRFLKVSSHPSRIPVVETIVLGVMSVLGLYVYISGVTITLLSVLTMLALDRKKNTHRWISLALFWGSAFLALFPLLRSGLIQNYGKMINNLGSLSSGMAITNWILNIPGYVSVLFWGTPRGIYSYQPVWGGFLDPILGSLFFLGLVEILSSWKKPFSIWLLAGSFLFFVPGIMTHDLEPFRNLPLLPLLGVFCAHGFLSLFRGFSSRKCLLGLGLLTLTFGSLDFYHLTYQYHHLWDSDSAWKGYAKSRERFHAFQILEGISCDQGPGLIYTDFSPGLCDQTLSVADHAFNAAQNPDLSLTHPRWVAVMVNANYKPFLARRFPDGRAYYLSTGLHSPDGGQMLWIMPVTPDKEQVLSGWQNASISFCCFPGRYVPVLRDNLMKVYPG
jgi:hypothetical protein